MSDVLVSLYYWFDIKRDEIIANHQGERVLISKNEVLGYFQDQQSALDYAKEHGFEVGDFLVQRCITREEEENMFCNVSMGNLYA